MFHAKDGWYFRRLNGGAVRIIKRDDPNPTFPALEATFTADEWCSIVASVSRIGETSESFADARFVHRGKLDLTPSAAIPLPVSTLPSTTEK